MEVIVKGKGSSPLTRGAQVGVFVEAELGGLIPAHAGSTGRRCTAPACMRAHPRSRGEHAAGP